MLSKVSLIQHLNTEETSGFLFNLHKKNIFISDLFEDFILQITDYKKFSNETKVKIINALLYFLKTLIYHFDCHDQSDIKFPKGFNEKMPSYIDVVDFLILEIVEGNEIDKNEVADFF